MRHGVWKLQPRSYEDCHRFVKAVEVAKGASILQVTATSQITDEAFAHGLLIELQGSGFLACGVVCTSDLVEDTWVVWMLLAQWKQRGDGRSHIVTIASRENAV